MNLNIVEVPQTRLAHPLRMTRRQYPFFAFLVPFQVVYCLDLCFEFNQSRCFEKNLTQTASFCKVGNEFVVYFSLTMTNAEGLFLLMLEIREIIN